MIATGAAGKLYPRDRLPSIKSPTTAPDVKHLLASLDKLADFDEIIDVRSPLELSLIHI